MEGVVVTNADSFWSGTRVLVTGHTGFKGAWLTVWLHELGATVGGYSLDVPTRPSLFDAAGVRPHVDHHAGDIRDLDHLRRVIHTFKPTLVVHLAAQALVRHSYAAPLDTFSSNVIGTAHVLEACRDVDDLRAVLICTSDKCYQNENHGERFREQDRLGGRDPYSASKACAELVTSAYRESFFPIARYAEHGIAVASVRAGNVIGGGDWAADRLLPDAARAFSAGRPLVIRQPRARRPWQFVLEPLSGYLMLARALLERGPEFATAWNFGPADDSVWTVEEVAVRFSALWGDGAHVVVDRSPSQMHEAHVLRLDSTCAQASLGWRPRFAVEDALGHTVDWYRTFYAGAVGPELYALTRQQIAAYAATHVLTAG
jgi:CDP-glucose 4,6-dehydratase